MQHRAFLFDWESFEAELHPILCSALAHGTTDTLYAFIDAHWKVCRDPYEGMSLNAEWRDLLQVGDVQELGDFAVAKYYDPSTDAGLGDAWIDVQESLSVPARAALLGSQVEADGVSFDPGKMGSYFQSPAVTRDAIHILKGERALERSEFIALLRTAVRRGSGIYVTF